MQSAQYTGNIEEERNIFFCVEQREKHVFHAAVATRKHKATQLFSPYSGASPVTATYSLRHDARARIAHCRRLAVEHERRAAFERLEQLNRRLDRRQHDARSTAAQHLERLDRRKRFESIGQL